MGIFKRKSAPNSSGQATSDHLPPETPAGPYPAATKGFTIESLGRRYTEDGLLVHGWLVSCDSEPWLTRTCASADEAERYAEALAQDLERGLIPRCVLSRANKRAVETAQWMLEQLPAHGVHTGWDYLYGDNFYASGDTLYTDTYSDLPGGGTPAGRILYNQPAIIALLRAANTIATTLDSTNHSQLTFRQLRTGLEARQLDQPLREAVAQIAAYHGADQACRRAQMDLEAASREADRAIATDPSLTATVNAYLSQVVDAARVAEGNLEQAKGNAEIAIANLEQCVRDHVSQIAQDTAAVIRAQETASLMASLRARAATAQGRGASRGII